MFIDERTQATRSAQIKCRWRDYVRAYPQWPAVMVLGLIIAACLAFRLRFWSGLIVLGIVIFLYLKHIRAQFLQGDLCPAMLVSESPFLVATLTDLDAGGGAYPILKVASLPRPSVPASQGQRLAAVCLYSGTTGAGHWDDCHPKLALHADGDTQRHQALLARIPEPEWESLTLALQQVPQPIKEGIYPLKKV